MMRDEIKARLELAFLFPLWVAIAAVAGIKSADGDTLGGLIGFVAGVVVIYKIGAAWRRA